MIILNTGIILIVLTLLCRLKLKPIAGFTIIFVIMAFQSNIDGDFAGYMEEFDKGFVYETAKEEPLWQFLYTFLRPIGSLQFNILLTLFELFVLIRLINKYGGRKYIWVAAILFYFTNSMMLIYMKAIRQTFSISICLLPFLFNYTKIKRFRWMFVFTPLFISFNVHNASLVFAPILLLFYFQLEYNLLDKPVSKYKNEFLLPTIITILFCCLYYAKNTVLNTYMVQIAQLMAVNDMRLSHYADMSEVRGEIGDISWLIAFYDGLIVFFASWYYNRESSTKKILSIMTIFASFWDMMFFGMGALMRVGYYFSIVNVAVLPDIAAHIEGKWGRYVAFLFMIICVAYAIKTTLPSFTSMEPDLFGNYQFIFLK